MGRGLPAGREENRQKSTFEMTETNSSMWSHLQKFIKGFKTDVAWVPPEPDFGKRFSKVVYSDVTDGTLNLEIYRNGACELVVAIFEDDKIEILLVDETKTYSAEELREVLDFVVPFSIETAGINDSVRTMDEERRKRLQE